MVLLSALFLVPPPIWAEYLPNLDCQFLSFVAEKFEINKTNVNFVGKSYILVEKVSILVNKLLTSCRK